MPNFTATFLPGVKYQRTVSKFTKKKKKKENHCFAFNPSRHINQRRQISRNVHVGVVQQRQRNVQKSVMHVQIFCFDNPTYSVLLFCRSRCRGRRVQKQSCLFYHPVRSNLFCNKSGCNSISAINTAGGKRGKRGKLFLLLLNCW